jgi:hypothetical protein
MNPKIKSLSVLALLVLSSAWANATVSLQFTDGSVITAAPGETITLHLQLVATADETSSNVDYLLAQVGGPLNNVFTLTGRDLTTSDYSDPAFLDSEVMSSADNHTPAGPDNLLNPQNDLDLGGTKPDTSVNYVGGTHYVATLTLTLNPNAFAGLYTIQTTFSSYGATGSNDPHDDLEAQLASIDIDVVPEPATCALLAVGLGAFGIAALRRRRQS